jgi:serine/threonine-protein kinase PknG
MTACVRSDCQGGTIDDEGICDRCSRAPAAAVVEPPPADPPSSRTRGRSAPDGGGPRNPPVWYTVPWERERDRAVPLLELPHQQAGPTLVRAKVGHGMVKLPAVAPRGPEAALLIDPVVAESNRFCRGPACGAKVGRAVDGVAGPPEGRCPACGTPYRFLPTLHPDDNVGQYRIRGCLGYGGQGWVYLGNDLNLDGDPVAIKGLRDANDARSYQASVVERRFLIEVNHPDIVQIRNFVQHEDPKTGRLDGYIVLEYLDGMSLAEKAARAGVLPVAEAIAYILAILPALDYLHDSGLVYGDFKPSNVMQVGDRLKLVDLGSVRRIGEAVGDGSWATRGFRAPEVAAGREPSVLSDLYTVGRTLAVLTASFDLREAYESGLPGPDTIPVFATYESFYRFICRATARDPEHRFATAEEMAEQLTGVLREVLALDDRKARPVPSALFTPERGALRADLGAPMDTMKMADAVVVMDHAKMDLVDAALALPTPSLETDEPAAAFLDGVDTTDPADVVASLRRAPHRTAEVELALILAGLGVRDVAGAQRDLHSFGTRQPRDWRLTWYRGLLALARGEAEDAWHEFAVIRDALPGELAPKLALAVCAESLHALPLARHYYETVWRTNDVFVGAAFGLARTYLADSDDAADYATARAITVLESIPDTLHHHLVARTIALRLRLAKDRMTEPDLRNAAARLQTLRLEGEHYYDARARMLQAAWDWLESNSVPAEKAPLLGVAFTRDALGLALERTYLALRRWAPTRADRVALVRRAHQVRPRSRW